MGVCWNNTIILATIPLVRSINSESLEKEFMRSNLAVHYHQSIETLVLSINPPPPTDSLSKFSGDTDPQYSTATIVSSYSMGTCRYSLVVSKDVAVGLDEVDLDATIDGFDQELAHVCIFRQ